MQSLIASTIIDPVINSVSEVSTVNFNNRIIPRGLTTTVHLWSPSRKYYGEWPIIQAERIKRHHKNWIWTTVRIKPGYPLDNVIPVVMAAVLILGAISYMVKPAKKIVP